MKNTFRQLVTQDLPTLILEFVAYLTTSHASAYFLPKIPKTSYFLSMQTSIKFLDEKI